MIAAKFALISLVVLLVVGSIVAVKQCRGLVRLLRQRPVGPKPVNAFSDLPSGELTPRRPRNVDAYSMLDVVVGSEEGSYPVCRLPAVTNAAGSAVASLAARAALGSIKSLRNQLGACCGEMSIEEEFTKEKLQEHINLLLEREPRLFAWTDIRISGPAEAQNLLARAFVNLVGKDGATHAAIANAQRMLSTDIIGQMKTVLRRVSTNGGVDSVGEIKSLLRRTVEALRSLCAELEKVSNDLQALVENVGADWHYDVKQLYESDLCRPVRSATCENRSTEDK